MAFIALFCFAFWMLWCFGRDNFNHEDELVVASPLVRKFLACRLGWHSWYSILKTPGREYFQCKKCGSRRAKGWASSLDSPLNHKWLKDARRYISLAQVKNEDYGALEMALRGFENANSPRYAVNLPLKQGDAHDRD